MKHVIEDLQSGVLALNNMMQIVRDKGIYTITGDISVMTRGYVEKVVYQHRELLWADLVSDMLDQHVWLRSFTKNDVPTAPYWIVGGDRWAASFSDVWDLLKVLVETVRNSEGEYR